MALDELVPSSLVALGRGIEAVLDQDVLDGLPGDLADTEPFELAQNASVAPTGLGPAEFGLGLGPSSLVFTGDPTGERPWRDDGDQLPQRRPELLAELDQPGLLTLGDVDP